MGDFYSGYYDWQETQCVRPCGLVTELLFHLGDQCEPCGHRVGGGSQEAESQGQL